MYAVFGYTRRIYLLFHLLCFGLLLVMVESNDQVSSPTEYAPHLYRLVTLTDLTQASDKWPLVMQSIVETIERKGYMDTYDWNGIVQRISYQEKTSLRDNFWLRASNSSSNSSASLQPGQIEVRCIEHNTMTYRFSCPSPPIDSDIFSGTISCG
ncbi:hypothetical protein GpartN1_g2759.t1 [Galdieria partita]|uniref:Uncharacterized protein n=1 Tax=Galdieria partita TaxID=83374 RepID=A0A9C7PUB1_9RHOD|nr:hypothetical protein GpartN1_g2759.t1 [Galdieria partita]